MSRTALHLALAALALARADNTTDWEICSTDLESFSDACSPWGRALEAWASAPTGRGARVLNLPARGYYVTDRVGLAPTAPSLQPTPYSEWQPPPPPAAGKIVNKPGNYNKDKFRPSPEYHPASNSNQLQSPQYQPQPPPQYAPGNQQHAPGNPQYTTGNQPHPSGNQQHSSDNEQHGVGNQQYGPGNQQHASGNQQHVPGNQQYGPGNQQHDSGNQQYGPGDQQHSSGNQLHVPGNQQHGPGNQQHGSGNPQYSPGNQQHSSGNQQLTPGNQPPPGNQQPQYYEQAPGNQPTNDRVDLAPQRKEVSETDLYLLAAIEKLVRRADLMEKRLRKAEEALHALLLSKEPPPEPCAGNFTRVGAACYWWEGGPVDWQSAARACRQRGSDLVELAKPSQRRRLAERLQADKRYKDLDWWTGGLNPGLLWIWAGSARPVLPNVTAAAPGAPGGAAGAPSAPLAIQGEGRCLALVWDESSRALVYRGQDCAFRHRFVCELRPDQAKLSNEIDRAARRLRGAGGGGTRQARLLLTDAEDHS